jgi:hypothetical protein
MKNRNGITLKSLEKIYGQCKCCGNYARTRWFNRQSIVTENSIEICRKCAYKEAYGTKGAYHMKQKTLETQF